MGPWTADEEAGRLEVVLIRTTGDGSLDYYAQKLAAELPVTVRWTGQGARSARRFNVGLLSAASLAALRHDVGFVRALRKETALVHFPNHHMGRYGRFLSRPYVVTVHDLIRIFDLDSEHVLIDRPNARDRRYLRLDVAGIASATRIIAVSETTKRDLVDRLGLAPRRVTVVHEGVDHERFRPVRPRRRASRYILYVGSEQPRKDLPTLVRAFARIRSDPRFGDVRLVKLGAPGGKGAAFRAATMAAVRACGLERSVDFVGRVPEADLPAWYSGAEILVLPSRYEGFGFPPLEAMACGCPVVVSDGGSLPEITAGAALVAPVGDDRAFAARAVEVLADASLRGRLVERGLARASEFSWKRAARETGAVYDELASELEERSEGRSRRLHWIDRSAARGSPVGPPMPTGVQTRSADGG